MFSKMKETWLKEDGKLIVKSPSQEDLVKTEAAKTALNAYSVFKSNGQLGSAAEIKANIEDAMQMAFERDNPTRCKENMNIQGPSII